MPDKNDFAGAFAGLKAILAPYAQKCSVVHDTSDNYYLNTRHIIKNKQPLFFAAVRKGKAYVSFHLMPVYASPELLTKMSPELKKRMQGKSCFNFKSVEESLFKELAKLTRVGFTRFNDRKFLEAIRKAQGG
ncbi:MAG TPA: hypothetical protein VGJ55_15120 [Pyrinomonadaceae bacterium]|jgi:hypothetical protein